MAIPAQSILHINSSFAINKTCSVYSLVNRQTLDSNPNQYEVEKAHYPLRFKTNSRKGVNQTIVSPYITISKLR